MLVYIKLQEFLEKVDFDIDIKRIISTAAPVDEIVSLNGEKVYVDARTEVRPNHIPILDGIAEDWTPFLIVADYITPNSKKTLKAKNINYIDSFGNAFINLKTLKLYVEKGNAKPLYNTYSKVFTQAGGQILFHLLQHPEKINETYRNLAEISCVSLGSVSKTINGLFNEGFAVKWDSEKKYQLVRREELLVKWVTLVNQKILPMYKIGSYRQGTKEHFKIKDSGPRLETCWGGEYGAKLITNYLSPQNYSLFTTRIKADLTNLFRLLPDDNGNITAYKSFWKPESIKLVHRYGETAASPLLVYAELMYSGNDRNIETAKIIFDEYIKPNL